MDRCHTCDKEIPNGAACFRCADCDTGVLRRAVLRGPSLEMQGGTVQAIVMRYNVMSSRVEDGEAIIHVAPFVLRVPIKKQWFPYRRAFEHHIPIEATDIGHGCNLEFNADYHLALEVKLNAEKGKYDWYVSKRFDQIPNNERMRYLGLCKTPAYQPPALTDDDFTCKAVMLHLPSGPVLRDIMIRRGRLYVRNTFEPKGWEDFGEIGDFVINNGTISAAENPVPLIEPLAFDEQRIIKRLIDGAK